MRSWIVRLGASVATALLAAASADAATEVAENLGWLGGSARDGHQEAILPVLLLGVAVVLALCGYVACARLSIEDRSVLEGSHVRARILELSCALAGSVLCVIAMEGYETRFGGFSPFDAQSVVLAHAPALLAAFGIAAAVVRSAIREMLFAAERAGERAVETLVRFVRNLLHAKTSPPASRASTYALSVLRLPNPLGAGSCGLRAPPAATTLRPIIV